MTEPSPDVAGRDLAAVLEHVDENLVVLDELLPYIAQLLEPVRGQRPMLRPRPTPQEEQRRAEQVREEKYDQVENERNRRPTPGKSPAPVSIDATVAAVTVSVELRAIDRRIWRHLRAWPPGQTTDRARLRRIRRNLDLVTDLGVARAIAASSATARRAAELLVDGEPNRRLNARCPYCHRDSLVVYRRDPRRSASALDEKTPAEVIRCDKPANSNCYCPSATCPCKRSGAIEGRQTYRHTWSRDRGGWDALATLIRQHDATCRQCNPTEGPGG